MAPAPGIYSSGSVSKRPKKIKEGGRGQKPNTDKIPNKITPVYMYLQVKATALLNPQL